LAWPTVNEGKKKNTERKPINPIIQVRENLRFILASFMEVRFGGE
jgi:hypothetical protein